MDNLTFTMISSGEFPKPEQPVLFVAVVNGKPELCAGIYHPNGPKMEWLYPWRTLGFDVPATDVYAWCPAPEIPDVPRG